MMSENVASKVGDYVTGNAGATEAGASSPVSPGTLHEAFANGLYPEWVDAEARKSLVPGFAPVHIYEGIASALDEMKSLSPEQRMEDYNWIVRYYSRSNKSFEDTSLRLYEHAGVSEDEVRSGLYDSGKIALDLLERMQAYDKQVMVPIIEQVSVYLQENFKEANVLFLGRDFASAYLYIVKQGVLKRENTFLCNVSRYVRDVALLGRAHELRLVLERLGLTKEVLLEKGLLIADSCMQGKIPAAIFKSLALPMTPEERYRFLTRCHIRYIKSSRNGEVNIAEKARKIGAVYSRALKDGDPVTDALTDEDLETLLSTRIERIEEFPINYPSVVAEYVPRRHKLFEWRPKVALIAMGITVDPIRGPHLIANDPVTPSERVLSFLGLYGEIMFVNEAILNRPVDAVEDAPKRPVAAHIVSVRDYQEPQPKEDGWYLKEIDAAHQSGLTGLRKWQEEVDKNIGSVAVMRSKSFELPYELVINGEIIYRFKDIVGEGNSVKAYVTDRDTIVKVIKDPEHVRKNLLLAWVETHVRQAGIAVAQVLTVSPTGLYLEQEKAPGQSLEALYSETGKSVPNQIIDHILDQLFMARRLVQEKGIWLDLKSANYHLSDSGKLINVDYTPRLNGTYYRYFQHEDRRTLSDEEFLDLFFYHDIQKRREQAAEKAAKRQG